jgi:methylenetetrahydrofolate dehydrogenase (NADP+) / methenyltetrahydrofolate cyclohydrolase
MNARIIDGKAAAARLRAELAVRVVALRRSSGMTPALAVIRVGDDPASALYVRNKIKACTEAGVKSISCELPACIGTQSLVAQIQRFNEDDTAHGILVQLPLPAHIDVRQVLESIAVAKDVDGFHLYVVIVGASNIVGKPMGLMFLQHQATVSICHARTRDLAQYTILADILVVAAGRPGLIVPPMVKTGAVVIDVGINRMPDGSITGGVGPMTVTMLLENTIAAAERRGAQGREGRCVCLSTNPRIVLQSRS